MFIDREKLLIYNISMDEYNILTSVGEGEYEDRHSRFIGHSFPISSEAEAQNLIDQTKRKYWDARHNCFAFVTGERGDMLRFSDDGEPGGTAGRPILDVITGRNLRGVLVVVTRYFGGTLLGTGGLVRAYTKAAQLCLDNAGTGRMMYSGRISLAADYTDYGRLQHMFSESDLKVESVDYGADVKVNILVPADSIDAVSDSIIQLTGGRCLPELISKDYFIL